MNKDAFNKSVKGGKNVQSEKLPIGTYVGQKLQDEYTVICETPSGWKPLPEGKELTEGQSYVALTDVKEHSSERIVTISVPDGFADLETEEYFSFRINGKGYSDVSLEALTKEQADELVKSDEIA